MRSEKSVKIWSTARVDSFVFLVSRKTKLYETGHCFAEFRKIEKNTKIRKYEKVFRVVLRNCETMFRFVFRIFFFFYFAPFIRVSYLLLEFRTFYSNVVTFYSSFVPFFDRDARAFLKYLHSSILPCVLRSRPIVSLQTTPSSLPSPHTLSTLSHHTHSHTPSPHTLTTHFFGIIF